MTELRITTTIVPRGPAAAILLDDSQVASLGTAKNPPVTVTIGERTARLRVARMSGENMIGLSKDNRAALGVRAGDVVEATIRPDTDERTVEVPPELAAALDTTPGARDAYDALSYTRRKELAQGVAEAKQPVTKLRRVAKALEELQLST